MSSVYMSLSGDGTVMINKLPWVKGNVDEDIANIIIKLLRRIESLEQEMNSLKYDVRNLEFND